MEIIQGAAAQGVIWGIMALGVFITFSILNFSDLTVDGSFALGGIMSAMLISKNMNPLLSLLAAAIAGALSGAVTGLLHTKLKIPGILSSILTMIALYSVTMRVGGGSPSIFIMDKPNNIVSWVELLLESSRNTAKLIVGLCFCILIIGVLYWFFGTEVGSAIRATGNNAHMARALGVDTDWMMILGLMLSNALVALSGGLAAQSDRAGNIAIGSGTIIIGLASVVIGSMFIKAEGSFALRLSGTVLGSILYQLALAFALQLGLRTDDTKLFTAIIVAIALSFPTFMGRYKAKQQAKGMKKC